MTDEEQKKIFANNLSEYMALNGKQQIDVSRELGINAPTLNMWCKEKSMPNPSKLRRLADYFGIGTSDLIEDKKHGDLDSQYADAVTKIGLYDERFKKFMIAYYNKPIEEKELLCDFFEKFIM